MSSFQRQPTLASIGRVGFPCGHKTLIETELMAFDSGLKKTSKPSPQRCVTTFTEIHPEQQHDVLERHTRFQQTYRVQKLSWNECSRVTKFVQGITQNSSGNKISLSFIIEIQKGWKCGCLLLNVLWIPLECIDSEDHVFLMWRNPSLFGGKGWLSDFSIIQIFWKVFEFAA